MNAPETLILERRAADSAVACAIADNTDVVKVLLERIEALEAGHKETKKDTADILEVLHAAQGGFKVLGVLATFLKYLTMIGAFGLFIWGLIHPHDNVKNP